MTLDALLERWSQGWRGPALAAMIALFAGLPGLFAMPALDRDESRFAQATAQMLESGDFVVIRFQDAPRFKKPVGIHWLQAASVAAVSNPAAREIWAYRIPSLLGAMLAAAACAWGAAAFFGASAATLSGMILGASQLLSTEAFIAKTDAVLCGATTLAIAALARIYAGRDGPWPPKRTQLLFWVGLSVAILVKGPVAPLVIILTLAALCAWDRRCAWLGRLGTGWGLIIVAGVCGPWAWAATVATDGVFWSTAIAGDLAPKLLGGQETHGGPPGYHAALAPLLAFPATLLIPPALALAWRGRNDAGVRFAICWLLPAWIFFELMPTKLAHYPLPLYPALAWLAAAALEEPIGAGARWCGAVLSALAGAALAGACIYLTATFGDPGVMVAATLTAVLFGGAGIAGAVLLARNHAGRGFALALGLGVLGHAALTALVVPNLHPLWLSHRVTEAMAAAKLLPRQGMASAPVEVAGYAEPSLVFALGTPTGLGGAAEAAQAIADGRPAVVEGRELPGFNAALASMGVQTREVGEVRGVNYSNGDATALGIYVRKEPP